jgi:predicted transcriptional regulator
VSTRSASVDLQKFVAQHVHSVEQMEILCVLCDDAQKCWSVAEIFRQVQSSEKSISDCLKKLTANGIVTQTTDGYRLAADKIPLVSELAEAYRKRRVMIIELIYKPTAPIEDFAEAFRLKKKE